LSDNPNLWWAYDSENGSFAPLPAGPLLLPAILIVGLISIFQLGRRALRSRDVIGGDIANSTLYTTSEKRYHELVDKKVSNGYLEIHEEEELRKLKSPPWIKSGTWTY
jgi:hypothetical protein